MCIKRRAYLAPTAAARGQWCGDFRFLKAGRRLSSRSIPVDGDHPSGSTRCRRCGWRAFQPREHCKQQRRGGLSTRTGRVRQRPPSSFTGRRMATWDPVAMTSIVRQASCRPGSCGCLALPTGRGPAWPGTPMNGCSSVPCNGRSAVATGGSVTDLAQGAQSCNIGYYPSTLYAGGQMSLFANALLFGGEVSSPRPPGFSPMGSGYLAGAGGLYAAYQWNTSYLNSAGALVPTSLSAQMCSSSSACFTLACANSNCNSFYFGGPGGASCP
jgi:hypothetical protein